MSTRFLSHIGGGRDIYLEYNQSHNSNSMRFFGRSPKINPRGLDPKQTTSYCCGLMTRLSGRTVMLPWNEKFSASGDYAGVRAFL